MPSLKDILLAKSPGDLNSLDYELFSTKISRYDGPFASLRAARDVVLGNEGDIKLNGPYKAICLWAGEDPVAEVPFLEGVEFSDNSGPRSDNLTRVIARIPELHSSLPKPVIMDRTGVECRQLRDLAILMHPVFYSFAAVKPEVGNIVEVDFVSEVNRSYGVYLGIVDPEARPQESDRATARSLFDNSTPEDLGSENGQ